MKFKQFYLGCLAHASYYIGSGEEAAVIDPQRDVDQYLDEAAANGQRIKYIIETHSHADFVSGHIELAEKTGAEIVFGRRAATEFPARKVDDGDELALGRVKLRFLETPGHTPEGITIVAENTEDEGAPLKMFTGDTLFIGDVGRPDLVGSKGFSAEDMAGMLYDSLHEKILPLPDETEVYPAHGAGSLCGKSMSTETWSTLGEQRRTNYALKEMSKSDFIRIVAADQPEVPAYFPVSAATNLKGAQALERLEAPGALSSSDVDGFDGVVIDVRPTDEFGAGHIPGSINIGLEGRFASWAGTLLPLGSRIAIAAENRTQVDEAVTRLARVGIETAVGFIIINEYEGALSVTEQVPPSKVAGIDGTAFQLVDVRRPPEYAGGHAENAVNIPLDRIGSEKGALEADLPTYVICQTGYRSSMAGSILEKNGFTRVFNIAGGTLAWIKTGCDMETVTTAGANA